ncbi:MAG: RND family transporter, partial [Oscillospiraceae bacterium]
RVPTAHVMVRDVTSPEAMEYKDILAGQPGVTSVLWLDSMVDITVPLAMQDAESVEGFYKDGNALFQLTIASGREVEAVNALRELLGEKGAVAGEAPDKSFMENAANTEVGQATAILVPVILLLLILSTTSWLEPILFLAAIGVSILINMGTNLFLGEVSFITNSVSPILQLAVSLDYAIFLLHSFADYRKKYDDVQRAMRHAIKKSVSAVAASATTTLFGFLALVFMEMGIGADLGINLAKGIVLSFVSSMVFLPALTLLCVKLLDKTTHRPFMPSFAGVGRVLTRVATPVLVVVLILAVPSFLGQRSTGFTCGLTDNNPGSRGLEESTAIHETFGQSTAMVIMVPRGDVVKEYELGQALQTLPHVTGVMSYASTVGTGIPSDFLDEAVTSQFYSEHYARIILYTDTEKEGDVAFATVEAVQDTVRAYYGDDFYAVGESVNLYDMRNVVQVDNVRVNLIAIVAIFLVLLVTFKSATLPFILLFTIEVGIWINLSIPYFMGEPINFLGYLIINTVQLGATVDYAILLTSYYMSNRQKMGQKQAIHLSLGQTFKSILVSGAVLAVAGFTLSFTSTNPIVAGLGLLLCRGTILSMLMVLCMLPALLRLFDKPTGKLTRKANFYKALPGPAAEE